MTNSPVSQTGSIGSISSGPTREDDLVTRTLEFIREQLPNWRDDPRRPKKVAEKGLNSSLCDFLDVQSRTHLPMARFKHEAPQTATRTVDIGVHGNAVTTTIGARTYNIYQPFLVIEAKRLPTPSGKNREREYVSGFDPSNDSPTGGIQRFKLGLHGSQIETVAMVGYIERHSPTHWNQTINGWITDLVGITSQDGCLWSKSDMIQNLILDPVANTASTHSMHQRTCQCVTPDLRVEHLWIVMNSSIAKS